MRKDLKQTVSKMFSTENKQTLIQPKAANCGKKYHWIRTFSKFSCSWFSHFAKQAVD